MNIEQMRNLTYEEAEKNYVCEPAAKTAASKNPNDIDVGDIVVVSGELTHRNGLPVFGVIVKRTKCTYSIAQLNGFPFYKNGSNRSGIMLPMLGDDPVPFELRTLSSNPNRFSKDGGIVWDGVRAQYWDGTAQPYEIM